jgi:hypothetical protein
MKINYNKNPLYTTITLDENEKQELWYKIKIAEMEDLLSDASFALQEGKSFNLDRARNQVDMNYYLADNDHDKSQLDERCDTLLDYYITALQSYHVGDCTCVPCSCEKCHAESLLGIDTISGIGKHSLYKINEAFGKDNEKTIDEVIASLSTYQINPNSFINVVWEKLGGYEQYIPRWKNEAKVAHDWLVKYKNEHLNRNSENENK